MKAAIILQKCTYTGKTFGIRVQQMEDGEWYKTWAFPIDEKTAQQEDYGTEQIRSMLPALAEYPGCPYCGGKRDFYDGNCGHLSCIRDETVFTCPWCNVTYRELVSMTEPGNFRGGQQ